MTHKVISSQLASAVADAGTFTASYPSRESPDPGGYYDEGDFYGAFAHKMSMGGSDLVYPDDFDLTFGTSSITVTNKTGATWPADTTFKLQLDVQGKDVFRDSTGAIRRMSRMAKSGEYLVNIGAPDVSDADGFCASQDLTSAGVFSSSVTAAAAIAAAALAGVCDTPRNVVAAWTGTAVLTITGKDVYGNTIVEKSASGTSMHGSKAFKTVTGISSSANITSLTVGTGNILGLPFRLPNAGHVLRVIQDGVALPQKELIQGEIDQTRLMAGTSVYAMNAHAGNVERMTTVMTTAVNTTGGSLTVEIATVAVTGLTVVVATGSVGDVDTDQPAAAVLAMSSDTTGMVAARGGIEIVGDSAFDSTGALNYLLELNTQGVFQAGAAVAGGQAATSGDVRGTFRPPVNPDGAIVWQLLVSLPDVALLGQDQYTG